MGPKYSTSGVNSDFMEKLIMDVEARKTPVLLFISKSHNVNYGKLMETVNFTLPTWDYLEKPVRLEDVIPKVENLLTKTNGLHFQSGVHLS